MSKSAIFGVVGAILAGVGTLDYILSEFDIPFINSVWIPWAMVIVGAVFLKLAISSDEESSKK